MGTNGSVGTPPRACGFRREQLDVEATERANQILAGWRLESSQSVRPAPAKANPLKGAAAEQERTPLAGSLTILWGRHPQEENVMQATLLDVSAFGARFRLGTRVPPGSWLMFNHHKIGISGRGTVRHCRMVKSGYEVGVGFGVEPVGTQLRSASARTFET